MTLEIALGALAAGKFVHDLNESDRNDKKAEKIINNASNQQFKAERLENEIYTQYNNSKKKIINRKRAILKNTFPKFKDVYEKIITIEFNDNSRGIEELSSSESIQIFNSEVSDIWSIKSMELSDEQLISSFIFPGTLSMLILGGGILTGISLGAAASIRKDSELNITNAEIQRKQAKLYAEAVETQKDAVEIICWHLDEVSGILAKLNLIFNKSIDESNRIINKNGYDSLNYSDDDLKYIGTCMNLAKAVKIIVDAPIIDEHDQLMQTAKQVIVTGNSYLEQFSMCI